MSLKEFLTFDPDEVTFAKGEDFDSLTGDWSFSTDDAGNVKLVTDEGTTTLHIIVTAVWFKLPMVCTTILLQSAGEQHMMTSGTFTSSTVQEVVNSAITAFLG